MINPFTEVKSYLTRNRIEKGVEIERSLSILREQSIHRKLAYDEDKNLHLQRLKTISERSDLKKGGMDELGFIKDKILDRLSTLEKGYTQETLDTVGVATRMKRELESLYKDENIKKSVIDELNRDRIGTAYETVLEAFKQKKIDKEAFKEVRKRTEGSLGKQVHYSDMIVRDVMGRILLLKRAEKEEDSMSGQWGLPGGHVDPGEDHKEAAIRELHEETAIEVKEGVYHVGEMTGAKVFIQYYEVYVDYIPVICINLREHSDYEWVSVYDLMKYDLIYDLKDTLKKIFGAELDPKVVEVRKAFNTILTAYFNDRISEKVVEDTYGVYLEKSEKSEEKKKRKFRLVLREFKGGSLRSSSGEKVIDRKQAVAIAMSEAGVEEMERGDGERVGKKEEVNKSLRILELAYEQGKIPLDVLEKSNLGASSDTSENRHLKRVGQEYGSKRQQEQVGKHTNAIDGDAKKETKDAPIEEYAKTASGSALGVASKEASSLEVRTAAHNELDRRGKEETPKKAEEEKPENKSSEFKVENKDGRIEISNEKGSMFAEVKGDNLVIFHAGINPEFRSKGEGKRMYSKMIEVAKSMDKNLASYYTLSEDSLKVWKSLQKDYEVKTNEGAKIMSEEYKKMEKEMPKGSMDMATSGDPDKPIFILNLKGKKEKVEKSLQNDLQPKKFGR